MKFSNPVPLSTIAQLIGAELIGNKEGVATGINEIHKVREGDIVFVDHPKYYDKCIQSDASFIIINKKLDVPGGKALLVVDDPFEAYQKLVRFYRPFHPQDKWISETSNIGTGSVLMPGVFIGEEVVIGKNCVIHANVSILSHSIIGDNVVIQSGTVIGSDAFYYNKKTNRDVHYRRMLSCGRVVVENDVEIGANCCIDRGVSDDTVIGAGTKLDNMIHIGHDTVIGKNCLFAAQVGIAGATTIEDNVVLWGQVGVNKTITVGKDAVVFGKSAVVSSLPGGKHYMGFPAVEAMGKRKEIVWIKRIPELWEKVMGPKS
jgi:UDP-3-O-[3-hydroxymyristoyl] glucosamine N-acyltransferase